MSKRRRPSHATALRSPSSRDPSSATDSPAGTSVAVDPTDLSGDSDGSSSDEQSEGSSEAAPPMPTIGGPKKPFMQSAKSMSGAQDLRARLAAFMPRIAQANNSLASGGVASIEDVEDGAQHIEMNLGLGVLEERRDGDDEDTSSEDSSDSEQSDDVAPERPAAADDHPPRRRQVDAMGKLMGNKTAKGPVGIQEIT